MLLYCTPRRYTQYIGDLMEEKDLKECNFCIPICKKTQQPLHDDKATSEVIFDDLKKTFTKVKIWNIFQQGV